MHTHDVRIAVILDGKEAFFTALSVEVQGSGLMVSAEEYCDVNGATYDLLFLAANKLLTEAFQLAARYPHATCENTGGSGRFGQQPAGPPGS